VRSWWSAWAGRTAWLTPRRAANWPPPTTWSATAPTSTGSAVRPGQRRHPSDNRVEAERAEFALDLAKRGRRVAVVSSGDPGVFAMATAVLEVAEDPQWKDVPVRVLPG
jgi:precorrin-2 C20-methyltransferase/precorrin-3B C17-methyltransferase